MSEALATAFVAIRPEGSSAAFKSQVDGVTAPALSSLKKGLASLGVGLGVGIALKQAFDQLKSQQEVAAITTARLEATGGAAGVTKKQIEDLAQSMQDLSGRNRDEVQAGENVLLSFKSVKDQAGKNNDIFTQTVKLSTDLAVAMGTDVPSAARSLGRALQNPANATRALRAANVILTKSQTDLIKSMVDSGDTLGAQKYILAQVKDQVGGAAKAYGETLPGQLDKAKASFLELGASVLQAAAPALTVLVKAGAAVASMFEALPSSVKTAIVLLIAAKVAAVQFGLSLDGVTFGLVDAAAAVDGFIAALGAEVTASQAAALNLAGLAAAYVIVSQGLGKIDEAQKKLEQNDTAAIVKENATQISGTIKSLTEVVDGLNKQTNQWSDRFNIFERFGDLKAQQSASKALELATNIKAAAGAVSKEFGISGDRALAWAQKQAALGVEFHSSKEALDAYRKTLPGAADLTDIAAQAAKDHADALQAEAKAIKSVADAEQAALDPAFAYYKSLDDLRQAQNDYNKAVKDNGKNSHEAQLALIALGQAAEANDVAQRKLAAGLKDGSVSLTEAKRDLDNWVASGAVTRAEADKLADKFFRLAGKANTLTGNRKMTFYGDTTNLEQALQHLLIDLGKIQRGVRGAGIVVGGGLVKSASGNELAAGGESIVDEGGRVESYTDASGHTHLINNGRRPIRIHSGGYTEAMMAKGGKASGLVYAPTYHVHGHTAQQALELANRKAFFELSTLAGVG